MTLCLLNKQSIILLLLFMYYKIQERLDMIWLYARKQLLIVRSSLSDCHACMQHPLRLIDLGKWLLRDTHVASILHVDVLC